MTDPKLDTQSKRRTPKEVAEIRKTAKSLGIKEWEKGKLQVVINKIEKVKEGLPQPDNKAHSFELSADELAIRKIMSIGFNVDWLEKLSVQYGFERYEYIEKFKAFRCYKHGEHVDWVDVNDLALLNTGKRLCTIMLRHQPVRPHPNHPNRACIDFFWRAK